MEAVVDANWVESFGELSWTDLDGCGQPMLLPGEVESLSIRRGTLTAGLWGPSRRGPRPS